MAFLLDMLIATGISINMRQCKNDCQWFVNGSSGLCSRTNVGEY